jgi:hypothetical protein
MSTLQYVLCQDTLEVWYEDDGDVMRIGDTDQ